MSYTIYFQAYENGGDGKINVQNIIECFEPYIIKKDEFGFRVKYDELNTSFIYINIENHFCDGFSVNRPCVDEKLYKSIFRVMKLGNFVSLAPSDDEYYIFDPLTIKHMPSNMIIDLENNIMKKKVIKNEKEYLELFI